MKLEKRNPLQYEWEDFNFEKPLDPVENPQDDNERFWNMQREWLLTKSPSVWAEMWELVTVLANKALHKELRKRKITIDTETFEEVAGNTVDVLLGRLQKYYGYAFRYIVTQVYYEINKQLSNRNDEYERNLLDLLNSRAITLEDAGLLTGDIICGRECADIPDAQS